jgi:Ring finger domain
MAELVGIVLIGVGSVVFSMVLANSSHSKRAKQDERLSHLSKATKESLEALRFIVPCSSDVTELAAAEEPQKDVTAENSPVRKRDQLRALLHKKHRKRPCPAQVHVHESGVYEVDGHVSFAAEECPICLETFAGGDELVLLLCQHTLHAQCILPWLASGHHACPVCKQDLDSLAFVQELEQHVQAKAAAKERRCARRARKAEALRRALHIHSSSATAPHSEQQQQQQQQACTTFGSVAMAMHSEEGSLDSSSCNSSGSSSSGELTPDDVELSAAAGVAAQ